MYKFLMSFSFLIMAVAGIMGQTNDQPEKRLALVIGNGTYSGSILANPENDARSIADVLKKMGFTVYKYENLTQARIKEVIDDFGMKLKGNTVGLFYYAGHGIQAKGFNYLIPVDAQLKTEEQVEYDCVRADRVLALMETSGTKVNIIILDACRNNPFERSWTRSATSKGLAFMNAPQGTLIAYATAPGSTASDGSGKNGLYTSALLESIQIADLNILQIFQNVRNIVSAKSQNQQIPWESTSLTADFYFNPSSTPKDQNTTLGIKKPASLSAEPVNNLTEALKDDYSGTYNCTVQAGYVMRLYLKQNENGTYSGTISDGTYSYEVNAEVLQEGISGYYQTTAGAVSFTGHIQNQLLTLTVNSRDYLGNATPVSMNFERSAAAQGSNTNAVKSTTTTTIAQGAGIIINGKEITKDQIQEIRTRYGVEPRPGNYWYDAVSGLYGVTGYPSYGFMYPGHNFGTLIRNCSGGNTGVIINGRELPQLEWAVWSSILGSYIQPGNYWFDSQGNAGYVGFDVPVVNLFAAARQNSYRGQSSGGDNFWSSRFGAGNSSADGSQGYVSVPGYGPVGYGF